MLCYLQMAIRCLTLPVIINSLYNVQSMRWEKYLSPPCVVSTDITKKEEKSSEKKIIVAKNIVILGKKVNVSRKGTWITEQHTSSTSDEALVSEIGALSLFQAGDFTWNLCQCFTWSDSVMDQQLPGKTIGFPGHLGCKTPSGPSWHMKGHAHIAKGCAWNSSASVIGCH